MKIPTSTRTIIPIRMITLALFAAALTACSFPGVSVSVPPTPPNVETIPTETPGPTITPVPSPTPTPAPPEGWAVFEDADFALRFYAPATWRFEARDEAAIDLRDDVSGAWLEIQRLTPSTAPEFGIPYTTGSDSLSVLNNLLGGLRQDGQFGDAGPVLTRAQRAAYSALGFYEIYDERIMVVAWGLPDRAFVLVGHEPLEGLTWDEAIPIYEGIINSLLDTSAGNGS